jgi:hypothetical protein
MWILGDFYKPFHGIPVGQPVKRDRIWVLFMVHLVGYKPGWNILEKGQGLGARVGFKLSREKELVTGLTQPANLSPISQFPVPKSCQCRQVLNGHGVFFLTGRFLRSSCFGEHEKPMEFLTFQAVPSKKSVHHIIFSVQWSDFLSYPLVMTNSSPWYRWPIEIDGLPFLIAW